MMLSQWNILMCVVYVVVLWRRYCLCCLHWYCLTTMLMSSGIAVSRCDRQRLMAKSKSNCKWINKHNNRLKWNNNQHLLSKQRINHYADLRYDSLYATIVVNIFITRCGCYAQICIIDRFANCSSSNMMAQKFYTVEIRIQFDVFSNYEEGVREGAHRMTGRQSGSATNNLVRDESSQPTGTNQQ